MAYIYQIRVVTEDSSSRSVDIGVSEGHNNEFLDLNWKGTATAQPGGYIVFQNGQQTESPFAFLRPNNGSAWYLDIEVRNIGSEFGGMSCFLTLSGVDTYATRSGNRGDLSYSNTLKVTGDTQVFRHCFSANTPYGFFGEYTIQINAENQAWDPNNPPAWTNVHISFPLELYYLSAPELPEFFAQSVPLLLLRMFVLPAIGLYDKEQISGWIGQVTKICFGSLRPLDGATKNTKDHWLMYNSGRSGAASFSSPWGLVGLNLQAWLDAYRNWDKHKVFTSVNCYDQAAINEVVLCLGIHHQQIHWEFHQVYGFISAELVGVGKVNSPYFDGVTSFAWYDNQADPNRQPFRNHAYLSWSEKPIQEAQYTAYDESMKTVKTHDQYVTAAAKFEQDLGCPLYMIDSCGGPHVGNEDRKAYEATIELITDPANSFSKYVSDNYHSAPGRWAEEHHLGAGVTDQFTVLPKGKRMDEYNTAVANMSALVSSSASGTVSVDIATLQSIFQTFVNKVLPSVWTANQSYTIRPYTTPNGTTVNEVKTSFSLRKDGKLDRAAALRIATNNDASAMCRALAEHLAFKAMSFGSENDNLIQRETVTVGSTMVNVVGSYYIRAFLWRNVAVEVTIENDAGWDGHGNEVLQDLATAMAGMTA